MRPTVKPSVLAVAMVAAGFLPAVAIPETAAQPDPVATNASTPASAVTHTSRLSKLMGMNAHDSAGELVGHVKDIVIDTTTGQMRYVVLASGGALGIGEALHAVPLSRVRVDAQRTLALDLTRQDLDASPAFDERKLGDATRARVAQPADAGKVNAKYRRASDLLKARVRDSHGGAIGKIDDLLVDVPARRVEQVVVKFDRAWNPNDKLIALPMSAFADGATAGFEAPVASGAAPPRNPPPPLALLNPSGEPTKGTASAINPPGAVETRPPAIAAQRDATVETLERQPLKTTTSYADDEDLVFKGTREQLRDAPAFDASRIGG